ncbi:MAG: hypothetical protein GXC94_06290 [Comamonadaceae bacterium]|nr:hypothetical protein [Comamonadaceae bacterium]
MQGCSSLSPWLARALQPSQAGAQPAVNLYGYQNLPFGRAIALSTWRVGEQGPDAAQDIDAAPVPLGGALLRLSGRPSEAPALRARLHAAGEGCESPREQLDRAAGRLERLMAAWYGQRPLPEVGLELVLPQQASSGARWSVGRPERLRIHVASQLPAQTDCEWTRYWVTETLGTVVHELLHFDTHVNLRRADDGLRDEYVAYLMEECVLRELTGGQTRRVQRFPGAEHLSRAQLIDLADRGRMPATVAGRMLAYRDWPGDAAAPWAGGCPRLLAEYPDPRAGLAARP